MMHSFNGAGYPNFFCCPCMHALHLRRIVCLCMWTAIQKNHKHSHFVCVYLHTYPPHRYTQRGARSWRCWSRVARACIYFYNHKHSRALLNRSYNLFYTSSRVGVFVCVHIHIRMLSASRATIICRDLLDSPLPLRSPPHKCIYFALWLTCIFREAATGVR